MLLPYFEKVSCEAVCQIKKVVLFSTFQERRQNCQINVLLIFWLRIKYSDLLELQKYTIWGEAEKSAVISSLYGLW